MARNVMAGDVVARDHAVVLGAGASGLFAATVLRRHFARVTVLDRDDLPSDASFRRGTPQARHPHLLLARGAAIVEQLHPGLLDDLVAAGTPQLDRFEDTDLEMGGYPMSAPGPMPERMYQPSRADLEWALRERVAALAEFRSGVAAVGLVHSRGRVAGVRLEGADGPGELAADLVVDATGRAARAAAWLSELGYGAVAEARVEIDVCYVSALLDLGDRALPSLLLRATTPRRPRGIGAMRVDPSRYLVTAFGYRGHHPAGDRDGILAVFGDLAPPEWNEALRAAGWPDRVAVHRYPAGVRRRFERLRRFPEGLLVVGDGLCSFNPLYGQGMTVAALQATSLDAALGAGDRDLAARYFAAAARDVDVAWRLAVAGDLGYPCVPGARPIWVRPMNRVIDAVLAAASVDTGVREAFLRVSWLLDPPHRLAKPGFVGRVLRHRRRGRRSATSMNSHMEQRGRASML